VRGHVDFRVSDYKKTYEGHINMLELFRDKTQQVGIVPKIQVKLYKNGRYVPVIVLVCCLKSVVYCGIAGSIPARNHWQMSRGPASPPLQSRTRSKIGTMKLSLNSWMAAILRRMSNYVPLE
jgi:hypothetical protein